MSKIVKVSNGDYSLQVQAGGNIILDTTGTAIGRDFSGTFGTVTVWGNLDVKGNTTQIETTNTTVSDNIFEINTGLTTNGIPSSLNYQGGWQIDRGTASAAQILFDDSVKHYDSTSVLSNPNIGGTYILRTADGILNAVQLRTITTDTTGDLAFDLQGGAARLSIVNSGGKIGVSGYTLTAGAISYAGTPGTDLHPWHVPNTQWNYGYVFSTLTPAGFGAPNGLALVNEINYPLTGSAYASVLATGSSGATGSVQFNVNSGIVGYYSYATGVTAGPVTASGTGSLTVNNVRIYGNTITDINNSYNLTLTSNSGEVEINAVLDLDNQTAPTYASGKTKLYSSSTIGPGRTGVYVTNSTVQTPDELISRSRAVLLSILL